MRKKVPLDLLSSNKSAVKHMRKFGRKAFYCNNDINKKENGCKNQQCYWIFKRLTSIQIYDLKEKRMCESRDEIFIEEKMGYEYIKLTKKK